MDLLFKIEKAAPVFFGALGSLILSALLQANQTLGSSVPETRGLSAEVSAIEKSALFFAETEDETRDLIVEMYGAPATRESVIDFFAEVCGSREIAAAILSGACNFNIPPALAFALGWEESRFNRKAINTKNRDGSIDRGLFQLNNRSFPKLDTQAFFDFSINTQNAMSHLRHCLNVGGTEVAALAMYNAGTGRVGSSGAPKTTLDYINRILRNREKIETRFETQVYNAEEKIASDTPLLVDAGKQGRSRFIPLMPLSFSF